MTVAVRFGQTDTEDVPVACLSTDNVGDVVCIRDEMTITGRWRIERADCFDESKIPAVGILISKSTPTTGIMRRKGPVDLFVGLDTTKRYYVGPAGSLLDSAPDAPVGSYVIAQKIGIPVDSSVLYLTGEIGSLFKLIGY